MKRMKRRLQDAVVGGVLAMLVPAAAVAADGESQNGAAALRSYLEQQYPGFEPDSIEPTPLDGVYEVVSGTDVMYISADGRYLLRGSLIDLQGDRNLTQRRRGDLVRDKIAAVGEDSMLVYPPVQGEAQYRITVFTDTTCPYCQRLHADLLDLRQEYPLEIRYLMFPRGGLESKGARELRSVWCSDDPQAALTAAKGDGAFQPDEAACDAPVKEHYELGREVGVDGTPFLIMGEDGPVVSGYRPKSKLKSMLGIESAEGASAGG